MTPRNEFAAGVRAVSPLLLGTMPFGLIYGVLAVQAGLPWPLAQALSIIVFAGSAQFIAAPLLGAGASGVVIVLTVFIVNLRHALYSASVAPHVRELPAGWKWLLSYLLVDEAYAVAIRHYEEQAGTPNKHWYFLGARAALWLTWQSSSAAGIFLGAEVPASWGLDFTLALTFIAIVVPMLKDRASTAAALAAGLVAVLAFAAPYKIGLLLAAFAGIAAGMLLEARRG
jgi:4-azaleucine resistance transporter AzlC